MIRKVLLRNIARIQRRLGPFQHELIYQNSYFEIAARTDWLNSPPLASPNGGTASFSLLFVLLSIAKQEKLTNILELGCGLSTDLLCQYVNAADGCVLTTVDQDKYWLDQKVAAMPGKVTPIHAPLEKTAVGKRQIKWYGTERPSSKFDLVLVDGPMSAGNDNRFDRLGIIQWMPEILMEDFIIIVDDSQRAGEDLLANELVKRLKQNNISVYRRTVLGRTCQDVIVTDRFRRYLYL